MSFWEQLNQLLSESPGNIIFHLVTLFAIQATLAIALGQWRRERTLEGDGDGLKFIRRLALAALGLLVTRLILLAVSLIVAANADATLPSRVLPPLEQFINTTMVILIVWALVPTVQGLPRLTDVAAILLLLLAGVMYAFFAQNWAVNAQAGMIYNGSEQSTMWGIFQLVLLVAGTLALLFRFEPGHGLRLFVMLAFLAAHFTQVWDFPETVPTQSEIPFWIRLGHLVALPLLAIVAYRHAVDALIAARLTNRPAPEQVANALQWAGRVIEKQSVHDAVREGVKMMAALTGARFAAIATTVDHDPEQLDVLSAGNEAEQPQTWALNLRDWPAFRMALDQKQPVELLPDGVGARQLHDLYQELGLSAHGSMLVAPLISQGEKEGILLLGGAPQGNTWPDSAVVVVTTLSSYLAQVVAAARGKVAAPETQVGIPEAPEEEAPSAQSPETQIVVSGPEPVDATIPEIGAGRLIALEQERDRLLEENQTLQEQLAHSETRLHGEEQRAHDLAATIEEYERTRSGDDDLAALEAEIAALRESLVEAEDALAMAAAAEGELSTEWVTTTISRYSGELEEAHQRIAELEHKVQKGAPGVAREVVTSLAQELRTPLTSVAGYTDLLLGETMGILGTRQRDFLQRVRSNVERMGVLLEQIVRLAASPTPPAVIHDVEMIDVQDVIDSAINAVIAQLRKKELRLNLQIAEKLPPVPANRDALSQVLIHLLNNALEVSQVSGEMTVSAHMDTFQDREDEEHVDTFVHVSVRDTGGGIRPEDRSHVFDPQYRADHPLIEGVGDTGAGLSVANTLVSAHGGRVWVDSEAGSGSTFTVLLPLSTNGQGEGEGQ